MGEIEMEERLRDMERQIEVWVEDETDLGKEGGGGGRGDRDR
jgi:hypothetical protein